MSVIKEFEEYLLEQAGLSIYVWGAQGELLRDLTKEKIYEMETSGANAKRAVELFEKRKHWDGARAFDCSGLGMYFLENIKGLYKTDKTADGLMHDCDRIEKRDVKTGDMVFKLNYAGNAVHVGYAVQDGKYVVEAKGRSDGVVKRRIDEGGWERFGRPKIFLNEYRGDAEEERHDYDENIKYGMRGSRVRELQKKLNRYGYQLDEDGIFGKKTLAAVKDFQRINGLDVDGIAGKKTFAALDDGGYAFTLSRLLKRTSPTIKGEDVKNVQRALEKAGFSVGESGVDGSYGPATERAVKAFQRSRGLKADGIVGKDTARALGGAWLK